MSIPVFVESLGWTSEDEKALQIAQSMPFGGSAIVAQLLARKAAETSAPGPGPGPGPGPTPDGGGAYPPAASSFPWGYVMAGAAALLLLGGGAIYMRRRRTAPALSGYHRARRRR